MKEFKINLRNYLFLNEFKPKIKKKEILIFKEGNEAFIKEVLDRLEEFFDEERTKYFKKNENIKKKWDILLFITEDENNLEHRNNLYFASNNLIFKRAYLIEKNYILLDIKKHFKFNCFAYVESETLKFLYDIAKKCPQNKTILEIGTYCGGSTISLGLGSKEGSFSKVITCDPVMPNFIYENIKYFNLENIIIPFEISSNDLFKIWEGKAKELKFSKEIYFLFLDGSHEYEFVLNDLNNWSKFISKGGFILIHDYYHPIQTGVSRALYKFLSENSDFKIKKKMKDSVLCLRNG